MDNKLFLRIYLVIKPWEWIGVRRVVMKKKLAGLVVERVLLQLENPFPKFGFHCFLLYWRLKILRLLLLYSLLPLLKIGAFVRAQDHE